MLRTMKESKVALRIYNQEINKNKEVRRNRWIGHREASEAIWEIPKKDDKKPLQKIC